LAIVVVSSSVPSVCYPCILILGWLDLLVWDVWVSIWLWLCWLPPLSLSIKSGHRPYV
jgi:hypothetical protein